MRCQASNAQYARGRLVAARPRLRVALQSQLELLSLARGPDAGADPSASQIRKVTENTVFSQLSNCVAGSNDAWTNREHTPKLISPEVRAALGAAENRDLLQVTCLLLDVGPRLGRCKCHGRKACVNGMLAARTVTVVTRRARQTRGFFQDKPSQVTWTSSSLQARLMLSKGRVVSEGRWTGCSTRLCDYTGRSPLLR